MNSTRTVAIAGVLILLVLLGVFVATRPSDDPVEPTPRAENPEGDEDAGREEPLPRAEDPKPEEKAAEEAPPEEKPEEPAPIVDEAAAIRRITGEVESAVFSLSVSNVTIREALEKLSQETGIAIDVNRLSNETLDGKIAFSFDATPLADALTFICNIKGLSYEIGPRGIQMK